MAEERARLLSRMKYQSLLLVAFVVVLVCSSLPCATMPRKALPCEWPSKDGRCGLEKGCEYDCGKCSRHCRQKPCDGRTEAAKYPSTPPMRRSTRDETDQKILEAARTPAAMKVADPDHASVNDFVALVPLPTNLTMVTRFGRDSSRFLWTAFINYGTQILLKLGENFAASPRLVGFVQSNLLEGIASPFVKPPPEESVRGKFHEQAFEAVCDFLRVLSRKDKGDRNGQAYRVIRTVVSHHFSERSIDEIQKLAGIIEEERFKLSVHSRTMANKKYNETVHCKFDGEPHEDDFPLSGTGRQSIVPDRIVDEAVAFVVDNCSLLSWGVRRVSDGYSGLIEIPTLTRQCVAVEMFQMYVEFKEKEKVEFVEVIGHNGPLRRSNSHFINSRYNLHLAMKDGGVATVSLYDFAKDDLASCALYGLRMNLLKEDGWIGIGKRLEQRTKDNEKMVRTMRVFPNGRNMLGRTSFLDLVRGLTCDDEKLITAVDYVRGDLVHVPLDGLQQIIEDLVDDVVLRKKLTKKLTLLGNFLKNQYKKHVNQDAVTGGTHGLLHGLTVPDLPSPHYSGMSAGEITALVNARLQDAPDLVMEKPASKMAKIAFLEQLDKQKRTARDDQTKGSSVTSESDNSTAAISTLGRNSYSEYLQGMKIGQLREEITKVGLEVTSRSSQTLIDALLLHREEKGQSDGSRNNDSSSDTAPDSDCNIDTYSEHLQNLKIGKLREEITRVGLDVKSRSASVLIEKLLCHREETQQGQMDFLLEDTSRDGVIDTDSSDGRSPHRPPESPDDSPSPSVAFGLDKDTIASVQEEFEQLGIHDDDIDKDCPGCVYLHYFMLDELPSAIQQYRTEANADQIDDALQYIQDGHEKFMIYQAHVARTVNQSSELSKMDKKLKAKCQSTKNGKPTDLWVIIDFKMKWEAMYLREKTTQNFAKRGTSWHGVYVYYHVWDSLQKAPAKYVAKVDQILEGTNEQSGATVMGCIEAMLVYLKQEFPEACIRYLQSDNANYYHTKELLLFIPQLNAVSCAFVINAYTDMQLTPDLPSPFEQRMRNIGGPMIYNFVHTETQDGKSLLDAHFAHATALIKRYLRRIRQNKQNQVTSPGELVDALSHTGGLQNCGVQMVGFDGEVFAKLESINSDPMMRKAVKKMKEYFGRCNEINYFPDNDSDEGKKFHFHAKAYSGVGPGAEFTIDLFEGKVTLTGGFASVDEFEVDEPDDGGEEVSEMTEDNEQPEILESLSLAAVERLIVGEAGEGGGQQQKRLTSTNGMLDYWSPNMLSGVKVEKFMSMGDVLSTTTSAAKVEASTAEAVDLLPSGRLLVVSRGLRCFKAQAFDEYGVCDGGGDSSPEEFKMVPQGFSVPKEFVRTVGWARRPQRGKMYGKKYLKKYKNDILTWFLAGAVDSTKKMGPGVMLEQLKRKYPGVYRLPSFVELQSFIGQLFKLQKEGKLDMEAGIVSRGQTRRGRGNADDDDDDIASDDELEDSDEEHEGSEEVGQAVAAAKEIIDQYGGLIEPKWVKSKIQSYLDELGDMQMLEFNKRLSSMRNQWLKWRKRCTIG